MARTPAEVKLALEDVVEHLVVLACVCSVDEVVAAHHTRNASHHAAQEWVCV
jgi:hypothetical protein